MNTTVTIHDDRFTGQRPPSPGAIGQKQRIGYESIEQFDFDHDHAFQLRGYGYNPLIDGALPLFGLVIRLRRLDRCEDVEQLYQTVRDQIAALDEEIRRHGYDSATQLAFRYALCSFIDEAVMGTPWGRDSTWAHRSLLSYYHNETWGGEKFFTVLSRMQMEPVRYRDVLEFKYLCLCLGFKGKYGVEHNQGEILNGIIDKLHRVLRNLRGDPPEQLTDAQANIASRRYRMSRQWPWWTPWLAALVVATVVYVLFAVSLGNTAELVLHSLDATLKS